MIKIQDIMTKDVVYYDQGIKDKLKRYCKDRAITYLPGLDLKNIYFLHNKVFEKQEIEKSLKVSPRLYCFNKALLKQFQKGEHILFVFDQDLIVGIIHFSDYNRAKVYTYLYELIANLERDLRKLLVLNNINNNDMLKFFKEHRNTDDVYKEKYDKFKDYGNKFDKVGPFEFFDLSDLVSLCDDKDIVRIDHNILELRNKVMHSRSGIKIKVYEQDPIVYNFESFKNFFNEALKLHEEFRKVHNRLKLEGEPKRWGILQNPTLNKQR